jgi:hypothetical protein
VPRAPLPARSVLPPLGRDVLRLLEGRYPFVVARTGSCARPVALHPASASPRSVGLCSLLPATAGHRPFPTLSLPIFPHVLGPLPRLPPRCIRSFLPSELWPSPIEQRVGASQILPTAISVGGHLRGCSHSIMFGPVSLLASQIAPTHTPQCSASLGSRDFYDHAYHGWLPSRAVVMLADQIRAIVSKWTLTTLDWQPCRLLRSMAGLLAPLSTLRDVPRGDSSRMTRGQYGLLFLYRLSG